MAKKKTLKQLPTVTLMPTNRSQAYFTPVDCVEDPDEDSQLYLQLYCCGMDVTVHLDREQADVLAARILEMLST